MSEKEYAFIKVDKKSFERHALIQGCVFCVNGPLNHMECPNIDTCKSTTHKEPVIDPLNGEEFKYGMSHFSPMTFIESAETAPITTPPDYPRVPVGWRLTLKENGAILLERGES